MDAAVAKDRAPTVDASIARKSGEPSPRFLDDDSKRGVIPWTATKQDDSIECAYGNK